jgi:hypothetical protein
LFFQPCRQEDVKVVPRIVRHENARDRRDEHRFAGDEGPGPTNAVQGRQSFIRQRQPCRDRKEVFTSGGRPAADKQVRILAGGLLGLISLRYGILGLPEYNVLGT